MTNVTVSGEALAFPTGFAWGAATAAYQIEGATDVDGRGPSVWDTFSHTPGKVRGGDTGDIACDSYRRYPEDADLLRSLGLSNYRFSISWPRILPDGGGQVNQAGLDYYKALLDALAERGITPAATLFHWDLPQALQDRGGWTSRDTALRLADYAAVVGEALGDRVDALDHAERAAGGRPQRPPRSACTHRACATTRSRPRPPTTCCSATAWPPRRCAPPSPASEVRRHAQPDPDPGGGRRQRLGRGPGEGPPGRRRQPERRCSSTRCSSAGTPRTRPASMLPPADLILDGDMETIAAPLDFLGVNYYQPVHLKAGDPANLRRGESAPMEGIEGGVVEYRPDHMEQTNMGWLIDPDGLYELLLRVSKDAQGLPLFITENGCAAEDYVNPDGVVNDLERIKFLHLHLDACARAIRDGANLAGYYVWSLLDNFEWAYGYQKRFGIVYVDFATQQRIPKASSGFFAEVARAERGARPAGRLAGLSPGRPVGWRCRGARLCIGSARTKGAYRDSYSSVRMQRRHV